MKNNLINKMIIALFAVMMSAGNAFAQTQAASAPAPEEVKALISKFVIVMIGLFAFSFILYIGLSIYNKFFVDAKIKDVNLRKFSLKSPKDLDEAVMMFIEKNRLQ